MPPQRTPSYDPYSILGVSPNATARQIKSSYHKLSLKFHPDKAGSWSHDKFVQIQEAYELLFSKAQKLEKHLKEQERRPKEPSLPKQKTTSDKGKGKQTESRPIPKPAPRQKKNESENIPPPRDEALVRIRDRATRRLDAVSNHLREADEHLESLRHEVEAQTDDSKIGILNAIQHVSKFIDEKKSEVAAASEQIKGVPDSEWRKKPEVQEAVDALPHLSHKVNLLAAGVNTIEHVVEEFKSVEDEKERKRLYLMLAKVISTLK
ncbi:uncharacterized protein F4807DRAFT_458950 [Annulohypoxylon truncatum]|uniref:uncharacterized protein n=1 Tax=Annulohypoxylon truncatum TaxID=327061 RepID=UPI0020072F22|nr:uncharacterized protein F4807DRAFT_458950 [Annulohypoxylon truncatum]KAI1211373.1 hypothetical protein F4807DRAFT_458950 [Annulohypoxylon truncatum]